MTIIDQIDSVLFPRESDFNATIRTGHYEQVSGEGVRPIELRWRQD